MSKYSQFFAIIKKTDLTKEEVVLWFTDGKSDSLSSLKDSEFNAMMKALAKFNTVPPGNEMRRKMFTVAKSMNYGNTAKQINDRIDNWCIKHGKYKKKLMLHNPGELAVVLTIFETKVYADYLSALNK